MDYQEIATSLKKAKKLGRKKTRHYKDRVVEERRIGKTLPNNQRPHNKVPVK